MAKKYLRLITHSIARFDLTKRPTTHAGLWLNTPARGGLVILAESKAQFFCLSTLLITHTDVIATQLKWFEEPFTLTLISKLGGRMVDDEKLLNAFSIRLKQSLSNLKSSHYQIKPLKILSDARIGFEFSSNIIVLEDESSLQPIPFESARLAINTLNQLGAYQLFEEYPRPVLTPQYDCTLQLTPMPILSAGGYFLWNILREPDYQLRILKNPNINQQLKDLLLDPYRGMPIKPFLDWYKDFSLIISSNAEKYLRDCTQALAEGKFIEATQVAEKALQNLRQLNETQVEAELAAVYTKLGQALSQQNQISSALTYFKLSLAHHTKRGNIEQVAQLEKEINHCLSKPEVKPLTFFSLPEKAKLNIMGQLKLADMARFARVSKQAYQLVMNPSIWKKRLGAEFTRQEPVDQPPNFYKYYKHWHQQLPHGIEQLDQNEQCWELNSAIKKGAHVWVENSITAGARLGYEQTTFENLLNSKNSHLINFIFKNHIDVDAKITTFLAAKLTIFHITAFLAPSYLPLLFTRIAQPTVLSAIHLAVINADQEALQALLILQPDIDAKDACGCTALWWALVLNNCQLAKFLIQQGASLDNILRSSHELGQVGYSILDHLIYNNSVGCLELLLILGLRITTVVNLQGSCSLLLVRAAHHGSTDCIRLFLKYGAIVNLIFDDDKLSNLYRELRNCESIALDARAAAIKTSQLDCLRALMEFSKINEIGIADSSKDHKHFFIRKYTPLIEAVENLAEQTVEYLLENGANPNQFGTWSCYEYANPDDRPVSPLSALADTFLLYRHDDTALSQFYSEAIPTQGMRRWLTIFELLVKHGADTTHTGKKAPFIFQLLEDSFSRSRGNKTGDSIIGYNTNEINKVYRQKMLLQVLQILSKYGINLSLQDAQGKTLLHHVVRKDYLDVVQYLVEHIKVGVNIPDNSGETAIFGAARNISESLFTYLHKMGSETNLSNAQGETPQQLIATNFMKKLRL